MPRRKHISIDDKLRLPTQDGIIQILDDYKQPALLPSAVAQIERWNFTPLWEYVDRPTLETFRNVILQSQIFKAVRGEGIKLYDPQHRRTIPCKEGELLVNGLSGEMVNFYLSRMIKAEHHFGLASEIASILEDLCDYSADLIKLGITRKPAFIKKIKEITKWGRKSIKILKKSMPATEKGEGELEVALYPYFKTLAKLSDDGIFSCIAYILKHLGIEKGNIEQIAERIRKRIERKRIKIKQIHVESLKKTLSHLRN